MTPHSAHASKTCATVRALMWLCSCVNIHVIIIWLFGSKTLATYLTNQSFQIIGEVRSFAVILIEEQTVECLSTSVAGMLCVMLLDMMSHEVRMLEHHFAPFVFARDGVRAMVHLDMHVHVRFGDVLGAEWANFLGCWVLNFGSAIFSPMTKVLVFRQEVFRAAAAFVLPLSLVNVIKVFEILFPSFGFKVGAQPALAIVVFAGRLLVSAQILD